MLSKKYIQQRQTHNENKWSTSKQIYPTARQWSAENESKGNQLKESRCGDDCKVH